MISRDSGMIHLANLCLMLQLEYSTFLMSSSGEKNCFGLIKSIETIDVQHACSLIFEYIFIVIKKILSSFKHRDQGDCFHRQYNKYPMMIMTTTAMIIIMTVIIMIIIILMITKRIINISKLIISNYNNIIRFSMISTLSTYSVLILQTFKQNPIINVRNTLLYCLFKPGNRIGVFQRLEQCIALANGQSKFDSCVTPPSITPLSNLTVLIILSMTL